jgi:hypothetical protein
MVRAIPLPVLMVGAGVFFAGSKTGQAASQRASDLAADVSDDVARRAREFGDQIQETTSVAKSYASDQVDRVSSAISSGADQVRGIADAAGAATSIVPSRKGNLPTSWTLPKSFQDTFIGQRSFLPPAQLAKSLM